MAKVSKKGEAFKALLKNKMAKEGKSEKEEPGEKGDKPEGTKEDEAEDKKELMGSLSKKVKAAKK